MTKGISCNQLDKDIQCGISTKSDFDYRLKVTPNIFIYTLCCGGITHTLNKTL